MIFHAGQTLNLEECQPSAQARDRVSRLLQKEKTSGLNSDQGIGFCDS